MRGAEGASSAGAHAPPTRLLAARGCGTASSDAADKPRGKAAEGAGAGAPGGAAAVLRGFAAEGAGVAPRACRLLSP